MWIYLKKLEFPVNITRPDARMAKLLMAQYGGPDSELAAAMRYLTQRFSMPDDRCRATLNDIGTEEMAHGCYRYGKTSRCSRCGSAYNCSRYNCRYGGCHPSRYNS